ncbi:MAG: DUF7333 family protein [Halobacteriota archaeon]
MEFDGVTTIVAFLAIVLLGVGGLTVSNVMETNTVVTMVAPSMVVFGGLALLLGVKHGQYRASS